MFFKEKKEDQSQVATIHPLLGQAGVLSLPCQPLGRQGTLLSTLHRNFFFFPLSQTWKNILLTPSGFSLWETEHRAEGECSRRMLRCTESMGECKKTWEVGSKGVLEAGQRDLSASVMSATIVSGHSRCSKRPLRTASNRACLFSPGTAKLKLGCVPGRAGSLGWPWLAGLTKPDPLIGPGDQGGRRGRSLPRAEEREGPGCSLQRCPQRAATAEQPSLLPGLDAPPQFPCDPVTVSVVKHLPQVLRFRADTWRPPWGGGGQREDGQHSEGGESHLGRKMEPVNLACLLVAGQDGLYS